MITWGGGLNMLLQWFKTFGLHGGFIIQKRIIKGNKQTTDKTYDDSEMKTRRKQRNVTLEIPRMSNNTNEIPEQKKTRMTNDRQEKVQPNQVK